MNIASAKKSKHCIMAKLEEVSMEYGVNNAAAVINKKCNMNFERVVGEWTVKANDMQANLEAS